MLLLVRSKDFVRKRFIVVLRYYCTVLVRTIELGYKPSYFLQHGDFTVLANLPMPLSLFRFLKMPLDYGPRNEGPSCLLHRASFSCVFFLHGGRTFNLRTSRHKTKSEEEKEEEDKNLIPPVTPPRTHTDTCKFAGCLSLCHL